MNESETRAEHIDPALQHAGWGVVEGSRIRREYGITLGRLEGFGRRAKPLSADYVLEYRNTKLAVIEARAWDEALTEGVAQAKNYAGKLAVRFAYSTNGQGIHGIDMQTGAEAEKPRYPTPDELWRLTFAKPNAWRDRFRGDRKEFATHSTKTACTAPEMARNRANFFKNLPLAKMTQVRRQFRSAIGNNAAQTARLALAGAWGIDHEFGKSHEWDSVPPSGAWGRRAWRRGRRTDERERKYVTGTRASYFALWTIHNGNAKWRRGRRMLNRR